MIVGRTLGQCVIEIGAERLGPESEVVFGAMLYLLSHAGRPVPRRALIELLWPGSDEGHARHCLRQTIYRLRRLGVTLEGSVEQIEVPLALSTLDHERIIGCPAVLLDTPCLLLGAYLPAYAPVFSRAFGDWVEQQRTVVHARLCRAALAVIGELRTQGRFADAEALARVCLELDPLNEEATLVLAESAAMSGSKTEALGILDRYLSDVGGETSELRLPATVLRRRIAERLPAPRYSATLAPAFVGRTTALGELTALWTESRAGTARMCLMWGDAGIGKTRLASELTTMAVVQGARAERVACQPVDARRPLSVFVELVPRLLAMRGAAGISPESMGHLRRVTEVDTASETPEEERPDASVRYAQVCRAIFDLIEAVTGEGSLVVVIENAHWLDAVSWRLLAEIPRRCTSPRLLLVLTSRVAPQALAPADSVAAAAACTPIHLLPLSNEEAGALVDSAAQRRSGHLSAEARTSCVRRGAGNPFFLQELTAHVVSGRGMATLPLTVQTLLEERLASVRPRSAQALQAIVLLGRAASVERVEALLEYKAHELIEALEELEAAGLLLIDGQTMGCRHELLAAEAVGRMAPAPRLVLHRRAARVLEREIEESRSATWLWECAAHWAHAGDGGRVVRLAVVCGEQLVEMGLPSSAHELYTKAFDVCPESKGSPALLNAAEAAATLMGDWAAVVEWIDRRAAARPSGSLIDDAYWDNVISRIEAMWRNNATPTDSLEPALRLAHTTAAPVLVRVRAAVLALAFSDNAGDIDGVAPIFDLIIQLTQDIHALRSLRLRATVIYNSKYGILDEAVNAARSLVDEIESAGDRLQIIRAIRFAAVPLLLSDQRMELFTRLEHAFNVAVERGYMGEAWATADVGTHAALEYDDPSLASEWLARMKRYSAQLPSSEVFRGSLLVLTARLAIATNDHELIERTLAGDRERPVASAYIRAQQRALSARLHMQMALGMVPSDESSVAFLRSAFERLQATGSQDYSAGVLFSVLDISGRSELADSLRATYLTTHRRERYVPASLLSPG